MSSSETQSPLAPWGKAVLEEILFQAGLDQPRTADLQAKCSLSFTIEALQDGRLHISCPSRTGAPISLHISL